MKALISTIEPRYTGYRVAQVVDDRHTFPVSEELFWVTCGNDVVQDLFWYDPADKKVKPNLET